MAAKIRNSSILTFGSKLAFSSRRGVDYTSTEDRKAFEIRFRTALAAGLGSPSFDGVPKTSRPVVTTTYSAVIPAVGGSAKVSLVANGFGLLEAGTHASLVLAANGQHSVAHFTSSKNEQAFTASLPFEARSLTDLRFTLILIVERDGKHPDASALIAVTDLSADAALP